MVGEFPEADVVVDVVVVVVVVVDVFNVVLEDVVVLVDVFNVVLEDVVVGSAVTVPMTQYFLLVSRLGQLMPGFNDWSLSTERPQLLAKLAHVAPLSAVVEKEQVTARREGTPEARRICGRNPATRRCVSCILFGARCLTCWLGTENARMKDEEANLVGEECETAHEASLQDQLLYLSSPA